MQIRGYNPMPNRPCDICLALQDDSVFADFKLDGSQLHLVRISFDGYGCYEPAWDTTPVRMTEGESARIVKYVRARDADRNDVHTEAVYALSSYFLRCDQAVWVDALRDTIWSKSLVKLTLDSIYSDSVVRQITPST